MRTSSEAIRIAIVEDQARVADSLTKLINRAGGFEVIGVYATGEAALADIPGLKPDVVLMDIGLPGISGIEWSQPKDCPAFGLHYHADGL